jgi:DNA-binding SARP family transcriptional activator
MAKQGKIRFKTFGDFDILAGGASVLTKSMRQQGFVRLFVFFLVNRGKVYGINGLVEKVWPHKDYSDNCSVVRTQVFRLKKHLAEILPQLSYRLEFSHGGYAFELTGGGYEIDSERFTAIHAQVFSGGAAGDEALALCREAVGLYENGFLAGEYFSECDWVATHRLNYRRLWFQLVERFVEECRQEGRYQDVVSLCQQILRYDTGEGFVHEIYMDALWKSGYAVDAARHYEAVTSRGKGGEALAASARLKRIYRDVTREINRNQPLDEEALGRFFYDRSEDEHGGALVCDRDAFLHHCSCARFHAGRSQSRPYVLIIGLPEEPPVDPFIRKVCQAGYLVEVLRRITRKSDVLCAWNDEQVLALLNSRQQPDTNDLMSRIRRAIADEFRNAPDRPRFLSGRREGAWQLPLNMRLLPVGGAGDGKGAPG